MSPLLQLTCFQMLIYGGMWLAAWVILGEERRAVLHWLLFSLLLAAGLALISLRPQGDPWLTVVLANGVLTAGFVVLGRGGALFLRLPTRDGEHAAVLACGAALALYMGPTPGQAHWVHPGGIAAGLIGWVLLASAWRSRAALTAQFGLRTARVALAPQVLFGLFQVVRCLQVLLREDTTFQLQTQSAANEWLVYMSMLSAAVFNLVFMFLIVLRLMGRLTYMVEHDALTGLLNRRAIEELLAREWARWRRLGEPFTLVSVDLDHFKQINDRWGHPAGDEVLRATARLLHQQLRSIDRFGRVGGEEFLVLMPGCAPEAATGVAERLRAALRRDPVRLTPEGEVPVTASLGVAAVTRGDRDLAQLIRRADAALYRAKHEGRDRVVVADAAQTGDQPAPATAPAASSSTAAAATAATAA